MKKILYNTRSDNVCGFCYYHSAWLTPTQVKKKKCLKKNCNRFRKCEHPIWEQRAATKELRKARKERMERMYLNAIHAEEVSTTRA